MLLVPVIFVISSVLLCSASGIPRFIEAVWVRPDANASHKAAYSELQAYLMVLRRGQRELSPSDFKSVVDDFLCKARAYEASIGASPKAGHHEQALSHMQVEEIRLMYEERHSALDDRLWSEYLKEFTPLVCTHQNKVIASLALETNVFIQWMIRAGDHVSAIKKRQLMMNNFLAVLALYFPLIQDDLEDFFYSFVIADMQLNTAVRFKRPKPIRPLTIEPVHFEVRLTEETFLKRVHENASRLMDSKRWPHSLLLALQDVPAHRREAQLKFVVSVVQATKHRISRCKSIRELFWQDFSVTASSFEAINSWLTRILQLLRVGFDSEYLFTLAAVRYTQFFNDLGQRALATAYHRLPASSLHDSTPKFLEGDIVDTALFVRCTDSPLLIHTSSCAGLPSCLFEYIVEKHLSGLAKDQLTLLYYKMSQLSLALREYCGSLFTKTPKDSLTVHRATEDLCAFCQELGIRARLLAKQVATMVHSRLGQCKAMADYGVYIFLPEYEHQFGGSLLEEVEVQAFRILYMAKLALGNDRKARTCFFALHKQFCYQMRALPDLFPMDDHTETAIQLYHLAIHDYHIQLSQP